MNKIINYLKNLQTSNLGYLIFTIIITIFSYISFAILTGLIIYIFIFVKLLNL